MDIIQLVFLIFASLIAYQVLEPLLFAVLFVGILWYLYQSSKEGFISYGGYGYGQGYGYGGYGFGGLYDSLYTPGYGGDPTYCQDCSQQSASDPSFCLSCANCAYANGRCVQRPGYPNVGPYTTFGSYLYPYSSFGHNIWNMSPLFGSGVGLLNY